MNDDAMKDLDQTEAEETEQEQPKTARKTNNKRAKPAEAETETEDEGEALSIEGVKKYLNDRVPELFDYDQFPVNKKQNMAIHREFVREALAKLLVGLEEGISNA